MYTQPASHSTAHFQFRCVCWTTRDPRSNCNDYPNTSGLRGWCIPSYLGSVPGVLFLLPFCDGTQCAVYIRANPTTPELERHLLFLFDTYAYFLTKYFSPFYHHSSHQLVLCRALLGKSADHASTLWISLLLLWFNTNIIFCDQIADASLPPRARLYPLKPQHTNFTTVKRQCRGE